MAAPGSLASQIPPGPDHVIREIADVKRSLRELAPSIAASFGPVIADLQAQQADLAAKQVILEDLIASQTLYTSAVADSTGMAVTTTPVSSAVSTITVPAGYTSATYTVLGSCSVINNTGAVEYCYLTAFMARNGVEEQWGGGQRITLSAGFRGSILAPLIRSATGLNAGDSLTFYVKLSASAAFAADAGTWTGTEVALTFSR